MSGHLYLLRHGETEWSLSGQHTGRTDLPLTANGEKRAVDAGRMLAGLRGDNALAFVMSSPRTRAVRTAELAELAVDEVTEDLGEWDYGELEGLTTPQIRETIPGWTVWTHPCPGGETADDIAVRAARVLSQARAKLGEGDVVLVGHGHFSRVLVATWLGMPPTAGVHFALDAAAIAELGDERGVPQVRRLNVPPLPERGFPHV
jgi:broad specificity phosphatase PhoE